MPKKYETVSIRLAREQIDALDRIAETISETRCAIIRAAVRAHILREGACQRNARQPEKLKDHTPGVR